MNEYYTAKQAAAVLGLKYHTLLARAHAGRYSFVKIGWAILFPKNKIDEEAVGNAATSKIVERSAR